MIRPSRSASCSGLRTSTGSAPSLRSTAACSRTFPCRARIPILGDLLTIPILGKPRIQSDGRPGGSMKLQPERDVLPAESLEDAADRAYRLQRVSERLAEALTPQQVLDAVLTEGLRAAEARAGAIGAIS